METGKRSKMKKQTKINLVLFFVLWIMARVYFKEHYTLVKWGLIAILLPIYGPRIFDWLKIQFKALKKLNDDPEAKDKIDTAFGKFNDWLEPQVEKVKKWAEMQKLRVTKKQAPMPGKRINLDEMQAMTSEQRGQVFQSSRPYSGMRNAPEPDIKAKHMAATILHHNKKMIEDIKTGDKIRLKIRDPRLTDRSMIHGLQQAVANVIDKNSDRIVMQVIQGINTQTGKLYDLDNPFIIKSNDSNVMIDKILSTSKAEYELEDIPERFEF